MGNAATTENEWITKQEAAEALGVSQRSIQKYVSQGKLTAKYEKGKTGEAMFVHVAEVENLKAIQQQMTFKPVVQSLPALPPPPPSLPMIPENISEALSRFLSMATMPPPSKLMLTLEEASSVSGLPKSFLKSAILESRLHAAKISRRWLIKRTALEAFIENL